MNTSDRFLKACRREPVDATPVWLMRQAGRYMPEYRELRRKHQLLDMIRTPELAAEVTLQPVRAFDVDAAIIFSDILPVLEGMGLPLRFVGGRGPVIDRRVSSTEDIEGLCVRPPEETLGFTLTALQLVKQELGGLPLIGFAGAPFTLACYAVEGGSSKDYARVKAWMHHEPAAWHRLLEKLATVVGEYLAAQAAAGADALQLFDSWAGILGPEDYRAFALPYARRAIDLAQARRRVPLIHFGTGTATLLEHMRGAGGDVLGVDWRIPIARVWVELGGELALQGNLDPAVLLSTPEVIRQQAARILDSVQGRPGHIFNLGHGVYKETPPEHVALLVDFVHEYSSRRGAMA